MKLRAAWPAAAALVLGPAPAAMGASMATGSHGAVPSAAGAMAAGGGVDWGEVGVAALAVGVALQAVREVRWRQRLRRERAGAAG
jgi:hypothetical protein